MSRTIFHVDVNSAFLSWTAVKRLEEDPQAVDLRTVPSAIGGEEGSQRGIIAAKSIPSKAYGIVTGEPVLSALKKCPNLILAEADFHVYREYSHRFMDILRSYSPLVEQASIDEAYVDLTGMEELYRELETEEYAFPLSVAYAIKDQVREELGFTVNVGISENKLLAKMASDFTKPDRVHTLFPEEVRGKMWPLPVQDLYGCGRRTAEKLMSIGIRTIGDAANTNIQVLQSFLGEKSGAYIYYAANGISESQVTPERESAKSYSNETTFSPDITRTNFEMQAPGIIKSLAESVGRRLRRDGVYVQTVEVSVKTNTFRRRSRQRKLADPTNSSQVLQEEAEKLLRELCLDPNGIFQEGLGIRLIGVGGSGIDDGSYRQMNLFDLMESQDPPQKKQRALDRMMDDMEAKYGRGTIHRGSDDYDIHGKK